jgi:hypothetical protein
VISFHHGSDHLHKFVEQQPENGLWLAKDHRGVVLECVGYLAVQAALAATSGALKPGDKTFKAGRLGEFQIQGDDIMLGKPFIFNKDNID